MTTEVACDNKFRYLLAHKLYIEEGSNDMQ